MRALALVAVVLAVGPAAAETRDEEHLVGDRMVKIAVVGTSEIMTVGPSDNQQIQVLSGADVEVVALVGDPDSVTQLGQAVVVAEVTGTQTCEDGDAREYWLVALGEVPASEGPVTTCTAMTALVTMGAVVLEGDGEAWSWISGKGWASRSN